MYCPDSLKLNKHQVVAIPKPREVFGRVGSIPTPANLYTGDADPQEHLNKVDEFAATERELLAKLDAERDKE